MSTTQSPAASSIGSGRDTEDRASRALRLFDDLLFEHPEYCSTCFARIRDRTEHDGNADTLGSGNRPTETLERVGDGVIGQDIETHDAHGAQREYRARTYCGECGASGGRAPGARICSMQDAISRSHNIIRALHRHGYYPDVDTLYNTVRRLKSDPERQGQDREIFATATFLAIERGREAPVNVGVADSGFTEMVHDDDGRPIGTRQVPWQPADPPTWLERMERLL